MSTEFCDPNTAALMARPLAWVPAYRGELSGFPVHGADQSIPRIGMPWLTSHRGGKETSKGGQEHPRPEL
jgi:hypothetical protein